MDAGRVVTRTTHEVASRVPRRAPRPTSGSAHVWRWLERALLLIGALSLGYWLYIWAEARLYQELENRELDIILATPPSRSGDAVSVPRVRPSPGSPVGRIEIPRLGVSAVIRAGSDARTLRLAVGHIPGTALPGEIGNIGLAGHRDTFFRRLRDIRPTDDIRVVTTTGTFTFKVDTTRVVSPKDTWVLDPTSTTTLTLVTCYPFRYIGSAPQRFIVHAVQ